MAFITSTDITTHLYSEQVDNISREDKTILTSAIDGAIAEAKGYLSAYDIDTIFKATGRRRNALLLIFVKDIAVWHFINLANPATDYEAREARYKRAVEWLKGVQKGDVVPDLPKLETDTDGDGKPDSGAVLSGSNPKRQNHF
ncbi:MAG: phage protein Gp36 family protein [Bacteroidales bacterium]